MDTPLGRIGQVYADSSSADSGWMTRTDEEMDGQLAVDVYQTEDELVVKAPIAGVAKDDLDISVTDETITIKGIRREKTQEVHREYFAEECYWGAFSRSYQLPVQVSAEHAKAVLKDGILTVVLPKLEKLRKKTVKVESE